jgi:hypothetical protein
MAERDDAGVKRPTPRGPDNDGRPHHLRNARCRTEAALTDIDGNDILAP